MTMIYQQKLTKNLVALAHDWQANKTEGAFKLTTLCDGLIAGRLGNSELYRAPKGKDADRSFYDHVVDIVKKGLPLEAQQLLAPSTKDAKLAFTDVMMAERRKWSQRQGADIGDIRNALERREKKRDPQKGATFESKFIEVLATRVKLLRKMEGGSTSYSITRVINLSNDLMKELQK